MLEAREPLTFITNCIVARDYQALCLENQIRLNPNFRRVPKPTNIPLFADKIYKIEIQVEYKDRFNDFVRIFKNPRNEKWVIVYSEGCQPLVYDSIGINSVQLATREDL